MGIPRVPAIGVRERGSRKTQSAGIRRTPYASRPRTLFSDRWLIFSRWLSIVSWEYHACQQLGFEREAVGRLKAPAYGALHTLRDRARHFRIGGSFSPGSY